MAKSVFVRLKAGLHRPLTEADLLSEGNFLALPPFPADAYEVMAGTSVGTGGETLIDRWRSEYRELLALVAAEPTWSLQRASVLRIMAVLFREISWKDAMESAENDESWLIDFQAEHPAAQGASSDVCRGVFHRLWFLAVGNFECLERLGRALYEIDDVKKFELDLLLKLRTDIRKESVFLIDFGMAAVASSSPRFAVLTREWFELYETSVLAKELKLLAVLEEEVINDAFDMKTFERIDEIQACRRAAMAQCPDFLTTEAVFADYLAQIDDAATGTDMLAVVADLELLPESSERNALLARARRVAAGLVRPN